VALGHVTRALLVPHEDVADRRVDERVVDRENGAARETEHDLRAFLLEALDEGLGSGELHRGLRGSGGSRSRAQKTPRRGEGWERTGAKARRALGNYEDAGVGAHWAEIVPDSGRARKPV